MGSKTESSAFSSSSLLHTWLGLGVGVEGEGHGESESALAWG